ncbi:solute carrier family 40 member 1-like protein [Dinothrombium tinctorium]|uniref:Solute carrier family 40 member n=1 Tax=Dinothrombium tinctorium TaxID=1965070 RepID=A0A3S3PIK3_9ACAR|nr:solute carrier family 40 member 1-like protein [Dinothrombium tinctorium]
MWEFAVGLLLIRLYPDSLILSAIRGIINSVAIIILSPIIGRWIERCSRLRELKITLFLQNGSIAVSALFVALYFAQIEVNNKLYQKVISIMTPTAFILFSTVAQVFSCGYTLVLEKDWLLALVTDELQLTGLNAVLRRIDLTCQTVSPFIVGILLQYSAFIATNVLCAWNLCSTIFEFTTLYFVYIQGPPSIRKPKAVPAEHKLKIIDVLAIKDYIKEFALPGISYSLVYLTVLGFDSVTVGFLSSKSVPDSFIGAVSVCAGIFGILGTIIFQQVIKCTNLRKTGVIGLIIQMSALTLCLFLIFEPLKLKRIQYFNIELPIILFISGLVISRSGLWMADLSVNQLIQTETRSPPLIGGVQNSVNIMMDLTKFILVAFFSQLEQFKILVILSYSLVALATFCFAIYAFTRQEKTFAISSYVTTL